MVLRAEQVDVDMMKSRFRSECVCTSILMLRDGLKMMW